MELHDAITILFERFNAATALWNLQLVVIIGVLGFLATSPALLKKPLLVWGLAAGYLAFASINIKVIDQVENQRRVIEAYVDYVVTAETKMADRQPDFGELPKALPSTLHTPDSWEVYAMHLTGDVAMIVAIFLIPYYRRGASSHSLPPADDNR
jgi:hypothetical protein